MKRVITLFLLVVFSTAFYAEKSEEENGLSLELTSNMRSPRVGQTVTIKLKIIGQAIADIIRDMNDVEPIYQKEPEFVCQFSFQTKKGGDLILGPYSLSFNGEYLESNSLILKVLPEWDGGYSTIFRVDCNEIYLGESFELVMETWSNEDKNINISLLPNPELALVEFGVLGSQTSIKDGEKSYYIHRRWIITPKSRGEFLITKDFFRDFPEDIEPPLLKVQVK